MMKHEFEALVKTEVSDEFYDVIETVYNYHPTIPEVDGKKVIADIFTKYGMGMIRDMYPTAQKASDLESTIATLRREVEEAQEKLKNACDEYAAFRAPYLKPKK